MEVLRLDGITASRFSEKGTIIYIIDVKTIERLNNTNNARSGDHVVNVILHF